MDNRLSHPARTSRRTLLAACAASALLAACGGGGDDLDDRTNTAEPQLRFVNAAPTSATALSLVLTRNAATVADTPSANLSYKGFSNYHDISNNIATTFTIRTATSPSADLASVNANPQRGRKYTVVALPSGIGANALLIDDPYNKPIGNDQARIRVVNASANAAPVDVYVTVAATPAVDLATVSPNFANVANQAVVPASNNNSNEFTGPGNYQVRITPAGNKAQVIFNTTMTINKNEDILFITVPSNAVVPVANDIKLLVVKSDDPGTNHVATELSTTP